MLSSHTGRRRLGAAVATVLAATLAAGALTAAPAAATDAPVAAAGPDALLPMVPVTRLVAAGPQGFLTYLPHSDPLGRLRWVRYEDGATRDTLYDAIGGVAHATGDTIVTASEIRGTKVLDVSTGTSFGLRPVDDGLDSLYGGYADGALFVRGGTRLWLETKDGADRPVRGMPEKASYTLVVAGDATHGLVTVTTAESGRRIGVIDLTDATLTFPYPSQARHPVVLGNRLAWLEDDPATRTLRVVVRDRTTGTDTVVPVPGVAAGTDLDIGLLGDWVTYGTAALRIGTGEKVALLDRADNVSAVPDGSAQIVEGRRSADGDGFFRVSIGAQGRPVVRLLAHAGTPTSALHDFDFDGRPDLLGRDASGVLWRDSAGDGLQRARIGGGWQIYDKIEAVGDVAGSESPRFLPELVARDKDGVLWLYSGQESGNFDQRVRVGPGWQTYTHLSGGSDLDGDGRPDVVAVDRSGLLWLYRSTGETSRPFEARKRIGHGWDIYNQLSAVGDLAGGPAGDLVARDKDGVLWLYLGKGDGTYAQRTRIGGGWQVYSQLMGAGDVDHDGHADLFAHVPGTKTVYLYSGTGDWRRPFEARTVSDAHTGNAYNHMS
ncbi:FG-GAP repeat domain-containing protein [Streptomyces sp. NPDC003703]|uniref:FG-GAP repeat domain-containing protein n=1 Tax=Streptomyces sp. NPDC003283 TaxID=3364681 RepID=UPI003687AF28